MNDILRAYGLTPWLESQMGDLEQGQPEVLDVVDTREEARGRVIVDLLVGEPDGGTRIEHVRVGGRAVVVFPYLDVRLPSQRAAGQIFMVKRWRVGHASWSYELPQAVITAECGAPNDPLDSPAHAALAAIFGKSCVDSLGAAHVIPLGAVRMDCRADDAEAYLLAATITGPFLRKKGDGEFARIDWTAMRGLLRQDKHLPDPVTHVVLSRVMERFDKGPPDSR